uniref:2Fe-2S ferredoxin-type domain-containing protein n=1 Tax=Nelumbo nucifera TaxID=4432 RepID=A0A822XJK1_NELNU|nr:TPA_asm: hypothetical protein HUJ06_022023 [Nelumbo nucifera]
MNRSVFTPSTLIQLQKNLREPPLTNPPPYSKKHGDASSLHFSSTDTQVPTHQLLCLYSVLQGDNRARRSCHTTIDVDPDETILAKALDSSLTVPHDCKLGVCMTCPTRLVSGEVDQSKGMLSDDVVECGYTLLCASYPRSDCHIRTIHEDELLSLNWQLQMIRCKAAEVNNILLPPLPLFCDLDTWRE